jgi:homogentisate 1,2-dioxygenase
MGYSLGALEATGGTALHRKPRKWERSGMRAKANTPIHQMQPKNDRYGLGYDPFQNAEAFRAARANRRKAGAFAPAPQQHHPDFPRGFGKTFGLWATDRSLCSYSVQLCPFTSSEENYKILDQEQCFVVQGGSTGRKQCFGCLHR